MRINMTKSSASVFDVDVIKKKKESGNWHSTNDIFHFFFPLSYLIELQIYFEWKPVYEFVNLK